MAKKKKKKVAAKKKKAPARTKAARRKAPAKKEAGGLRLETDELGDLGPVDAAELARILGGDAFGSFVILSAADDRFVQAACTWSPSRASQAFLEEHGSDPWILEHREGRAHERVVDELPLARVQAALLAYLAGDAGWRDAFEWVPVDV
jgi:hypothetical protein